METAIARALAPFAPPQSEVHQIVLDADAIDREMLADKLNDGYTKRNEAAAFALQVKSGGAA